MTETTQPGEYEIVIADKLRGLVTSERLAANAYNYEVMHWEPSPLEGRQLEAIRARLLGMPLLHGTQNPDVLEIAKRDGLLPYVRTTGDEGNSFPVDHSLGLDEYVFMNWGRLDQYHGNHFVVVDARAMLEGTIVTPDDIVHCSRNMVDLKPRAYQDLSDGEKAIIDQEYLDKMVTGDVWLDIVARQVHQFASRKPDLPFPVSRHKAIGEVKRYGSLDPRFCLGSFSLPDASSSLRATSAWNDSLLKYGIAVNIEEANLPEKGKMLRYDVGGPELWQQAGWQEIMAIE
ncbi:MAG TPA: hypothetical protein VJP80_05300 [Candidatus Saccharimonadales bacterium]|nr:hypothetical protein [Candidatus Saccharimonadales bacterium]